MTEELMLDMDKMGLSEEEIIRVIRNGFAYSISGKSYLPMFDTWAENFRQKEGSQ